MSLIGKAISYLGGKRGGYSMRVHHLARAHMHVQNGSSTEMLIPYLSADTQCVWLMKVGLDNFQIEFADDFLRDWECYADSKSTWH